MELHLVADTNLFFECKKLEDLPWEELNNDRIVIYLTKPVLDEIDKHKNSSGRTRERAIKINGIVRSMLENGTFDHEIRESAPRVLLRRARYTAPDPDYRNQLDYTRNDDRLIGFMLSIMKDNPSLSIQLFTGDTGALHTADVLELAGQLIPKTWRRPSALDAKDKKIRELKARLSELESQEPKIELSVEIDTGVKEPACIRLIPKPLTNDEVNLLVKRLCDKHPMRTDFTPPKPFELKGVEGEQPYRVEHSPPEDKDIREYQDVRYPRWVEQCRSLFTNLHLEVKERDEPARIRWLLTNNGTRPAHQLRIEFIANGRLLLRYPEEDKPERKRRTRSDRKHKEPHLPAPPSPPRWPSVRIPKASSIKLTAFPESKALRNATKTLERFLPVSPRYDLQNSIENQRDAESFYFCERDRGSLTRRSALTCDLFRHKRVVEEFEWEVHFDDNTKDRGSVECVVHAENMSKPIRRTVTVIRASQELDLLQAANDMVDACESATTLTTY